MWLPQAKKYLIIRLSFSLSWFASSKNHFSAHVVASKELRKGKIRSTQKRIFLLVEIVGDVVNIGTCKAREKAFLVVHLHVPLNFFYTSVDARSLTLSPLRVYIQYFFAELLAVVHKRWVNRKQQQLNLHCVHNINFLMPLLQVMRVHKGRKLQRSQMHWLYLIFYWWLILI